MKRICKTFAVLLVMAIALFSFSITAGATEVSNTQDGLVASIISEKDSYKANKDIELTFKVTNTNDFAVENVSLEAIIPDGLTLKNNDDTTVNTVSLGSGESLELTLTAVKESSVITVPIGESTEPNTENLTETATKTVVQTNSIQATTTKVNSATSDTVSTNGSDNTTIQTGKTMSYLLVGLICLVCLAVAVIFFRFRKKAVKYLSLVLCVCIAVGSVAFVSVTNTMAKKTTQQMSFEVSKNITVDNENYIIQSSLIYDKIVKENDNDYENFEKVQQTTVNIEKKYLNSDGYVDYKDTQKLFEEITDYLQTQKDLGIIDYFTQGSSSIFIKMKSGINYMYIPEYKDYLSSGSEHRIITFEPVKSSFEYKFEKFYADFYIDFGSLCLGTENLDTDLIENAELLGKESKYKYSSEDSYIDEEVTINKLLNLSPNSLILFEGHGGYSEETGSVLWTDEKVNENVTYNFGEDAIVYSKDKTIGVTYQFFEKLQNNSLENSTIYLGACCSAKDERLANSLIDKGAENVLGYSDIVGIRYEIGLRTFLLYGLTLNHDNGDAYTLEEAYNFALSTYGTKDSREPYAYLKILQREHYGTLSASVISSDNTPLPDVRVDAYLKAESGTQYVGNTYTDDKGNFSMELQEGSYELRFNKDGYKTATTTIKISKDVMTVLKDPIVMEKEITESTFKVAKDLLYVNDKYIYSGKSTIYLKESPTDKVKVLTGVGNNGHNSIGSMMSDGHTLYFTASPASLSTNCVVYSYNIDHPTLKNLFVSKGEISFLTCYDNCIYYLDNEILNKYDWSSGKNTAFSNSDLKIDNGSHIRNASSIGQKLYLEVMNSNSKYGDYVIIEFDLNSTSAKVFLNNSSIISSHQNANEDKLYFSTLSNNDWYICSVDKSGNFTKSPKISSKLTLSQGVITYDEFALMRSDSNESDFDLYKFNLQTGNITVIKGGAGGFKNKGCGLMYDEKNREDIYISGAAKFNGNGYDATNVTGEYDPYKMWIIDGYIINRDFEWLKIN